MDRDPEFRAVASNTGDGSADGRDIVGLEIVGLDVGGGPAVR